MDPNEYMQQMIKEEVAKRIRRTEGRTVDVIVARLLHNFSDNASISGQHDFETGYMQIVCMYQSDPDFKMAMQTVAKTILNLFPNKKDKPQVDLSDDEEEGAIVN